MEDKDQGRTAEPGMRSCVERLLRSQGLAAVEMASLGMVNMPFRG